MTISAVKTRFILIETSHAGNVGAAARALKVMGFDDLVLVKPRWPDVLTRQGRKFVKFFEAVATRCGDAKEAANWTTNELLQTLNEREADAADSPISAVQLGQTRPPGQALASRKSPVPLQGRQFTSEVAQVNSR